MMLVVSLVVHIFQMGIKLPYAISSLGKDAGSSGVINNAEQIEVAEENAKTGASDNVVTFSGASLKDGTYEGSAEGYASVITVSVVVENGSVTDISIVEENYTPQFFEYAKEIINTILNRQSLEVDGITGATYSSKGIQNAVYDALQHAVISGEFKISDIQISNGHGHGKSHHRPKI